MCDSFFSFLFFFGFAGAASYHTYRARYIFFSFSPRWFGLGWVGLNLLEGEGHQRIMEWPCRADQMHGTAFFGYMFPGGIKTGRREGGEGKRGVGEHTAALRVFRLSWIPDCLWVKVEEIPRCNCYERRRLFPTLQV